MTDTRTADGQQDLAGGHDTWEGEGTDVAGAEPIRKLVALASQILAAHDQSDYIWGHASARDPEGRGVWIKQSGWGMAEISPDRTHLIDFEGEVVAGEGSRHLEYHIHTEIMAARPDIGGVVHTHAPYAVALGAAGVPLLPVSHAATFFVPPELPRFTATGDLILSAALGRQLSECLGEASAILLVNHGIVTVGPDIQTATCAAVLLEDACRQQLRTLAFSASPTWSDAGEAAAKRQHAYPTPAIQQMWNHLVRGVRRTQFPGAPAP